MQKTDQVLFDWRDVPAAVSLLTRLPVFVAISDHAQRRDAAAAWAFPIVGLKVAVILCLIAFFTRTLGLPDPIIAGLMLAASVVITGAMHEDGLADSADGLWGGWEKARRLEIMKDSHIGAYGVLALLLSLLLRWQCLSVILGGDQWIGAVIATAMTSRATMVAMMTGLPHARDTGLSHAVGRPLPQTAWLAIGVATLGSLLAVGLSAGSVVILAVLATLACATIARRKIGGQTGDILGATQQLTEITLLMFFAAQAS